MMANTIPMPTKDFKRCFLAFVHDAFPPRMAIVCILQYSGKNQLSPKFIVNNSRKFTDAPLEAQVRLEQRIWRQNRRLLQKSYDGSPSSAPAGKKKMKGTKWTPGCARVAEPLCHFALQACRAIRKNKCIAQPCRFPRRQGEALHYRMAILMGEERRCAPNFWRKPLLLRRRTCGVREVLPGYASLHLCQDGVELHSGNGGATFFAAHNNARQVAFHRRSLSWMALAKPLSAVRTQTSVIGADWRRCTSRCKAVGALPTTMSFGPGRASA